MSRTISSASMSLDGFIAYEDHTVGALFDWYDIGDVPVATASDSVTFELTARSAEHWREFTSGVGAIVVGRRLFDVTDGWGGRHPLGVPVVVVTHRAPADWSPEHGAGATHFVTTGVADAVATARGIAGDRDVSVAAGTIASQALELGVLDAVAVELVPVVLGSGRPYFTSGIGTHLLRDPSAVVVSDRVTHLVFEVDRDTVSTGRDA